MNAQALEKWRIPSILPPEKLKVLEHAWAKPRPVSREVLRFETGATDADIQWLLDWRLLSETRRGFGAGLRPTVLGLFHLPAAREELAAAEKLVEVAAARYRPGPPQPVPASEWRAALPPTIATEDLADYASDLRIGLDEQGLFPSEFAWEHKTLEGVLASVYEYLLAKDRRARPIDLFSGPPLDLRITGFHAKNFRALRDLDLPIGPVSFLVGPNAVGKSTALDVPVFIARACEHGIGPALGFAGGYDRIVSSGAGGPVEIELRFELREDARVEGRYHVAIDVASELFFVESETLELREAQGLRTLLAGKRGRFILENGRGERETLYAPPNALGIVEYDDSARFPMLSRIRRALSRVILVDVDPVLRRTADDVGGFFPPPARTRSVLPVEALIDPFARDEKLRTKLSKILRDLIPPAQGLETGFDPQGRPTLRVVEPGMARPLDLDEISAGTRQMLLVAALHVLDTPLAAVLLEEPDARVHPSALPALAALLRSLGRRTTVLVTTHSAAFLSHLDSSSEVWGMRRVNGGVEARHIEELARSPEWLEDFGTTRAAFERISTERR